MKKYFIETSTYTQKNTSQKQVPTHRKILHRNKYIYIEKYFIETSTYTQKNTSQKQVSTHIKILHRNKYIHIEKYFIETSTYTQKSTSQKQVHIYIKIIHFCKLLTPNLLLFHFTNEFCNKRKDTKCNRKFADKVDTFSLRMHD